MTEQFKSVGMVAVRVSNYNVSMIIVFNLVWRVCVCVDSNVAVIMVEAVSPVPGGGKGSSYRIR